MMTVCVFFCLFVFNYKYKQIHKFQHRDFIFFCLAGTNIDGVDKCISIQLDHCAACL